MFRLFDEDGKPTGFMLFGLLAIAAMAFIWWYTRPASAEGIVNNAPPIGMPSIASGNSWSGCGIGVGGSYLDGEVSGGGLPVNIGSDGQMIDGRVLCDLQAGNFVIGANVDYGKAYGDLQSLIGLDTTWAVGGRVGPLVNPSTLLFVSGGWTRADTSAAGTLDGYYFGGGIETKLPNSPLYLVLEYRHQVYDIGDLCPGSCPFDATMDVIRVGANIKLNFGK